MFLLITQYENKIKAAKSVYRFYAVSWVTWGRRRRFANDKKFLV